jgi:hypothetical protein
MTITCPDQRVLPAQPRTFALILVGIRDPMKLKLNARVNRSDAETIRNALEQLSASGSVTKTGDEFVVEAEMEGASTRELNRTFLSALRKVEKRTTLRAEWTSGDGTTERFFDYVLKKTVKN